MSSRVCATGHIKDFMPPIEKSGALCPCFMFPPSCIHQVIIITGVCTHLLYCFPLTVSPFVPTRVVLKYLPIFTFIFVSRDRLGPVYPMSYEATVL